MILGLEDRESESRLIDVGKNNRLSDGLGVSFENAARRGNVTLFDTDAFRKNVLIEPLNDELIVGVG